MMTDQALWGWRNSAAMDLFFFSRPAVGCELLVPVAGLGLVAGLAIQYSTK
ncbi:MAG: hypothetical protein ACRD2O_01165 [Terriglobia bacterium]